MIAWAALKECEFPQLRLLHAIPNGGHRHYGTAVKLQKEGVRPGVPDLFLPVAIRGFHGLYVEMKKRGAAPSDVKPAQRAWIRDLIEEKYAVGLAKDADAAREVICSYLTGTLLRGSFQAV